MAINLGDAPDRLTVKLSRFGDFVAALVYDDGDPATVNEWPAGVDIELRFYTSPTTTTVTSTWPAVIAADRAEWDVDKSVVVDDVLDPDATTVRLVYIDGATDLLWASGTVKEVT